MATNIKGKFMASKNAITHGIFAQKSMLSEEESLELETLATNLIQDLQPANQIEAALVDRIIQAVWRQRRLQRAESAQIALAQMPFNVITEVNTTLNLDIKDWKNGNDLKEATSEEIKSRENHLKIREEFQTINITEASKDLQLLRNCPIILANLKTRANNLNLEFLEFTKNSSDVENYLLHLKDLVEKRYQADIEKQLVRAIGEIVKETKVIPKPAIMDQLMKYQVQLDNDLYKALAELRKAREYRLKTIEAEVIDA